MADKIKGITIELDGDARKLNNAVKSVASRSKEFQDELRKVERLLKFDPKNTELLAQKQKLLADSVNHTRDALQKFKDAKADADKTIAAGGKVSEEQYRHLQREIIETEQKLRGLEKAQGDFNSKVKKMTDGLDSFSQKTGNAAKSLAPVSAAAGAAGIAAIRMGVQFDDAMAKVSTIADTASVPLDKLRDDILEASNVTGVAAAQIADDVYNAISAGQSTGDAVNFVVQANKLAQAGFAEQAQALDVMTTILNAYGLEASEASRVMDILINTQNLGKTTVGELSQVMGKIIPTANASNISLEQLGAAYALMTSNGIAAAETTTYTNSLLNELSKSGSKSSDMLKNKTGKSFQQLSADGESLADVLLILDEEAKKSGVSIADMFGSAEAAKAANVLIKESGQAYNDMLTSMQNSGGATDTAFEKLQTDNKKFMDSLNEMSNAGIKLGGALSPVFSKIAEISQQIAEFLSGLSDEQMDLIAKVLLVVAALAPVLMLISKMASGVSDITKLMKFLVPVLAKTAFTIGAMSVPVWAVIAGIIALIAIGVALYKNWDTIKAKAAALYENIKASFAKTRDSIVNPIMNAIDTLKKINLFEIGKNIISGLIDGVAGMIGKVKETIGSISDSIIGGLKNALGIRSPSKITEELGKYTGEGMIKGLESTKRALSSVSNSMGSVATAGAGAGSMMHTGTIRVEGINDKNQLVGVADIVMEQLRREVRRK
jgi:TP901 family phage tail tape measure protein